MRHCPSENTVVSFVFGVALAMLLALASLTLASCTPEPCVVGVVVNAEIRCTPVR